MFGMVYPLSEMRKTTPPLDEAVDRVIMFAEGHEGDDRRR